MSESLQYSFNYLSPEPKMSCTHRHTHDTLHLQSLKLWRYQIKQRFIKFYCSTMKRNTVLTRSKIKINKSLKQHCNLTFSHVYLKLENHSSGHRGSGVLCWLNSHKRINFKATKGVLHQERGVYQKFFMYVLV